MLRMVQPAEDPPPPKSLPECPPSKTPPEPLEDGREDNVRVRLPFMESRVRPRSTAPPAGSVALNQVGGCS